MKALSILQPWASLCVIRWESGRVCKMFETRSWATKYRGPLAIHASKGFPRSSDQIRYEEPFLSAIVPDDGGLRSWFLDERSKPESRRKLKNCLPLGKIIGTVHLVDCVPVEKALKHPLMTFTEQQFGDYTPGRFAWLFEDATQFIKAIPAKGSLGLWEWEGMQ